MIMQNNAEFILDYETNTKIEVGSTQHSRLAMGVVSMRGRVPIFGYFTPNPSKNFECTIKNQRFMVLSKDIFVDKFLIYDNRRSQYTYAIGCDDIIKKKVFAEEKGRGGFPYNIRREYNAQNNLELFSKFIKLDSVTNNPLKKLIPYTFGLEYETSEGYVPEHLCYAKGLIPLRDGSITGVEYASIVLNGSTTGFDLIKEQVSTLKEYTSYDKECSLHIHFGNFPMTPTHIAGVFFLCNLLQDHLSNSLIVPVDTFTTRNYKASGKDYCKKLPKLRTFDEIYSYLAGSIEYKYLGSLTQSHPNDQRHEAKWNVNSRYYWVNFINTCFYKSPKTIELRFLRPSYNYNKIVNWIFIFSGILKFIEAYVNEHPKATDKQIYSYIESLTCDFDNFDIYKTIFEKVYPKKVSDYLINFLHDLQQITRNQTDFGDTIGKKDIFDDKILTTNVLDLA